MEVQFTQEQETQLAQMARRDGKADASQLGKDAALRLLDEEVRFRAAVLEGKAYADRGEFIEEEEMDARRGRHAEHQRLPQRAPPAVSPVDDAKALRRYPRLERRGLPWQARTCRRNAGVVVYALAVRCGLQHTRGRHRDLARLSYVAEPRLKGPYVLRVFGGTSAASFKHENVFYRA